jgi:endonuclease/exonuclease/phosphatase family metal-dependent hydrolase
LILGITLGAIILIAQGCKAQNVVTPQNYPLVDFKLNIENPTVGEEITFEAESKKGSSEISSWQWDFGSGGSFTTKRVVYKWYFPGVFRVTLTAIDKTGQSVNVHKEVVVKSTTQLPPNEPQDGYITLRILTYNIFHGETTAGTIDMDMFGNIIKEQNPDLVALQEVDKSTSRVGGIDITSELSKRTGLAGYFCKHRDYQGGEYGNAILSKYPIVSIDMLEGYRNTSTGVMIPFAKVEIYKDIYIYFNSSHLSTDLAVRQIHVRQLLDYYVKTLNKAPLLICGDLNAEPHSEEVKVLLDEFTISDSTLANTFSTRTGMKKKIDYVLHPSNSSWKVEETKVIYRPDASDHCALLVVLKYKIPISK